ncbi:MAG: hypothetical protein V1910_00865, partial [bacterium]
MEKEEKIKKNSVKKILTKTKKTADKIIEKEGEKKVGKKSIKKPVPKVKKNLPNPALVSHFSVPIYNQNGKEVSEIKLP